MAHAQKDRQSCLWPFCIIPVSLCPSCPSCYQVNSGPFRVGWEGTSLLCHPRKCHLPPSRSRWLHCVPAPKGRLPEKLSHILIPRDKSLLVDFHSPPLITGPSCYPQTLSPSASALSHVPLLFPGQPAAGLPLPSTRPAPDCFHIRSFFPRPQALPFSCFLNAFRLFSPHLTHLNFLLLRFLLCSHNIANRAVTTRPAVSMSGSRWCRPSLPRGQRDRLPHCLRGSRHSPWRSGTLRPLSE